MVLVPDSPVKFKGRIVSPVHFEMDGVHSHLARFFLEKHHGLFAKSAAAEGSVNVQLINESIVTVKLEAESNGQHNVADRQVSFEENPDSSKGGKG